MDLVHGTAEVIIAKQRRGPTGTVDLQFEGQFARFSDLMSDSICRRGCMGGHPALDVGELLAVAQVAPRETNLIGFARAQTGKTGALDVTSAPTSSS